MENDKKTNVAALHNYDANVEIAAKILDKALDDIRDHKVTYAATVGLLQSRVQKLINEWYPND